MFIVCCYINFQMADTEELGSQTALNGQNMGLLNGVQSTGNVQVHSTVCRPTFLFPLSTRRDEYATLIFFVGDVSSARNILR